MIRKLLIFWENTWLSIQNSRWRGSNLRSHQHQPQPQRNKLKSNPRKWSSLTQPKKIRRKRIKIKKSHLSQWQNLSQLLRRWLWKYRKKNSLHQLRLRLRYRKRHLWATNQSPRPQHQRTRARRRKIRNEYYFILFMNVVIRNLLYSYYLCNLIPIWYHNSTVPMEKDVSRT